MSVRDRRGTVDGSNCKYREFVYLHALPSPVEIDKQFWEMTADEKQLAYTDAVIGVSKPSLEPRLLKETLVDVMVRERVEYAKEFNRVDHSYQIWLMPNEYTAAKQPYMATTSHINYIAGFEEEMVRQMIKTDLRKVVGL